MCLLGRRILPVLDRYGGHIKLTNSFHPKWNSSDATNQVTYTSELSLKPSQTKFSYSKNFPEDLKEKFSNSFLIYENFVTPQEEENLMVEFEKHFKRHLYEKDHWDNAIVRFRETEKKFFNKINTPIIERMRTIAFPMEGNLYIT